MTRDQMQASLDLILTEAREQLNELNSLTKENAPYRNVLTHRIDGMLRVYNLLNYEWFNNYHVTSLDYSDITHEFMIGESTYTVIKQRRSRTIMVNVIPDGTVVKIRSKDSIHNGELGTVQLWDGVNYHVAMFNDKDDCCIFDRKELAIEKNPDLFLKKK